MFGKFIKKLDIQKGGERGMVTQVDRRSEGLLMKRYKLTGDANDLEALVIQYRDLSRSLARRFQNRGIELDDLIQVADLALVKAIDRFDLNRGLSFSSYAVPTISGEIKRHFRDRLYVVRPPRAISELAYKIKRLVECHVVTNRPHLTVSDLAELLEVTEEDIMLAQESINGLSARSFEELIGEDLALGDTLADPGEAVDEKAFRKDEVKWLMKRLTEREREVLWLRFYCDLTQLEIGGIIGVSQMQVSRIIRQALAKMRVSESDNHEQEVVVMGKRRGDIRLSTKAQLRVMECLGRHDDRLGEDAMAILVAETGIPIGDLNKLVPVMNSAGMITGRRERGKWVSLVKCGVGAPVAALPAPSRRAAASRPALADASAGAGDGVAPSGDQPAGTMGEAAGQDALATGTEDKDRAGSGVPSRAIQDVIDNLAEHGEVVDSTGLATRKLATRMGISYAALSQRLKRPEAKRFINLDTRDRRTYCIKLKEEVPSCQVMRGGSSQAGAGEDAMPDALPLEVDLMALAGDLQRAAAQMIDFKQVSAEAREARATIEGLRSDLELARTELAEVMAERDNLAEKLEGTQAALSESRGLQQETQDKLSETLATLAVVREAVVELPAPASQPKEPVGLRSVK